MRTLVITVRTDADWLETAVGEATNIMAERLGVGGDRDYLIDVAEREVKNLPSFALTPIPALSFRHIRAEFDADEGSPA